ncbi:biotin--[acetyl-CoA-carboxylase] ligase [Mesobacterium pallidum]|uniref:biotin--[acetyl-CoA-carboxylase] ligase n=1 Tax=Mesobacterium pallidum TaxID=2872037 RepID=UPI001EE24738
MTWPAGYGRRVLAEVDSTNAEAARIAAQLAGPEWILGLRQTAGRGRRGRPWVDPVGNFAGTLVMRPTEGPEVVALRSFVAALALYDALAGLPGLAGQVTLKWPNDVLLAGGKVAGILLESAGGPSGMSYLAIGIGVNLASAPDVADLPDGAVAPVSVAGLTGQVVGPEDFLNRLAPAYAEWESRFATYGFAPIRTAWLARAARLGERITARTGRETLTGLFETVDAQGNLCLNTAQGRRAIPAADVFFEGG